MKNKTLLTLITLFLLLQLGSTSTMDVLYKYPYNAIVATVKVMRSTPAFFLKQANSITFWKKNNQQTSKFFLKQTFNKYRNSKNIQSIESNPILPSSRKKCSSIQEESDETWLSWLVECFFENFGMNSKRRADIDNIKYRKKTDEKFDELEKMVEKKIFDLTKKMISKIDKIDKDVKLVQNSLNLLRQNIDEMNALEAKKRKAKIEKMIGIIEKKIESLSQSLKDSFSQTIKKISEELKELETSSTQKISQANENVVRSEARMNANILKEKKEIESQSKKSFKKKVQVSKARRAKLEKIKKNMHEANIINESCNNKIKEIDQNILACHKEYGNELKLITQDLHILRRSAVETKKIYISNKDKHLDKKTTHFNGLMAGVMAATIHRTTPLLQMHNQ